MFYNSCNLFKYVYIITCTSYTLSANTHNYDFTVYNVISSSAKDNSRRDFFLIFFPVKLVTCIIIHSNILLLTCIYVLPFIFHCIICFYLFTLWRFNKVNQSINQLPILKLIHKTVIQNFSMYSINLSSNKSKIS